MTSQIHLTVAAATPHVHLQDAVIHQHPRPSRFRDSAAAAPTTAPFERPVHFNGSVIRFKFGEHHQLPSRTGDDGGGYSFVLPNR